jgi:DDE family transposase
MEERLVMDYTTLGPESKEGQEQPPKGMQSLYKVCQQVVDGRAARGKRYELAGLLVVLVLAKLAGMQSLLGASEWIADQEALLREGLQLSWKRMPCTNTYSYALERLDSQQVNAALAAWFERKEAESRCGQEPSRLVAQPSERHVHLAIDGKALRGTGKQRYGGEEPQKQVLHVYEVQTGIVLHQCPIAPEHNEVSTLKPLLTEVLCKGRILTSDAAQSYHDGWRAW